MIQMGESIAVNILHITVVKMHKFGFILTGSLNDGVITAGIKRFNFVM